MAYVVTDGSEEFKSRKDSSKKVFRLKNKPKDLYLETNLRKFASEADITLEKLSFEAKVPLDYLTEMYADERIVVRRLPAYIMFNLAFYFKVDNIIDLYPNIEKYNSNWRNIKWKTIFFL